MTFDDSSKRIIKLDMYNPPLELIHWGNISLPADSQVTFVTERGGEYDVCRKEWGFYATPSLNQRLLKFWLRGVLVKSEEGKFLVLLVERGCEDQFYKYLDTYRYKIIVWLDNEADLRRLESALAPEPYCSNPHV